MERATGPSDVVVRRATRDDAQRLCDVSSQAIRASAAGHYTGPQRQAWAARRTRSGHERLIADTATFVAVVGEEVAGFACVALEPVGELQRGEVDQLFVSPPHGGRGVARALLVAVEAAARAAGVEELVTHASWRAAPVFERLGYERVEDEAVRLGEQVLTRALMRRRLPQEDADATTGGSPACT